MDTVKRFCNYCFLFGLVVLHVFSCIWMCWSVDVLMFWCVLICFGVFWCVLMCFDVFWCVLLCFDVFWYVAHCALESWHVWKLKHRYLFFFPFNNIFFHWQDIHLRSSTYLRFMWCTVCDRCRSTVMDAWKIRRLHCYTEERRGDGWQNQHE